MRKRKYINSEKSKKLEISERIIFQNFLRLTFKIILGNVRRHIVDPQNPQKLRSDNFADGGAERRVPRIVENVQVEAFHHDHDFLFFQAGIWGKMRKGTKQGVGGRGADDRD
jgi:hypothetical protein